MKFIIIGFSILVFTLTLCVYLVNSKEKSNTQQVKNHNNQIDPLPDIFKPFHWQVNDLRKIIKRYWKKAKVQEREGTICYKDKVIDITLIMFYDIIKWKYFDDVNLNIYQAEYKQIYMIGLETAELRYECSDDNVRIRPKDCRNQYGKELVAVFNNIKKHFIEKYSNPVDITKESLSSGDSSDPIQKWLVWRRKGFNLFLTIDEDEMGVWAVHLDVERQDLICE